MKKYIISTILGLLIPVALYAYTTSSGSYSTTFSGNATAVATSTFQALFPNAASSTLITNIDGANTVAIQFCNTASSSTAFFDFQVWYSPLSANSTSTWYQETASAVSAGVATHSPLTHTISLATTTTSYQCSNAFISPILGKQIMVRYGTRVATTSLYLQIIPSTVK